jgi:hypothetical protein
MANKYLLVSKGAIFFIEFIFGVQGFMLQPFVMGFSPEPVDGQSLTQVFKFKSKVKTKIGFGKLNSINSCY